MHLATLEQRTFKFKYSTMLEICLLERLIEIFLNGEVHEASYGGWGVKEVNLTTTYVNYVVLSASYEYFRRHMKKEYNRIVMPELRRCRKAKTRNKRRAELSPIFFTKYAIQSKLYRPEELTKTDTSKMSDKEIQDRYKMMNLKGGEYKTQVTTGLYLDK